MHGHRPARAALLVLVPHGQQFPGNWSGPTVAHGFIVPPYPLYGAARAQHPAGFFPFSNGQIPQRLPGHRQMTVSEKFALPTRQAFRAVDAPSQPSESSSR